MTLELDAMAAAMDATVTGQLNGVVMGWSVDSRTVAPRDAYFALRGPNHDGHAFVGQAFAQGAACAVVDHLLDAPGPVFQVANTLDGLQNLARSMRRRSNATVVAVTGSAGKTSTKDIVAQMLSTSFSVGKTAGNLNNHVGVPLSILRLPDDAQVAVLELAMNHAGEIRALAEIAQPQIGVVTNVGYAHVEFFDSIDGIAAAKRELIDSLPADGIAVLNADDSRVAEFNRGRSGKAVFFGTGERADVRAESIELLPHGSRFRCRGTSFENPFSGHHGVLNALAGIAVASQFGVPLTRCAEALQTMQPGNMRGEIIERGRMVIYNDCYNSNPEAAQSMIDLLVHTPARRRIAVLGEMLELGPAAERLHRELGLYAEHHGVDLLFGVRGAARFMVDAAVGIDARYFETPRDAGAALREIVKPGDAILFKGSRGVKIELALQELLEGVG